RTCSTTPWPASCRDGPSSSCRTASRRCGRATPCICSTRAAWSPPGRTRSCWSRTPCIATCIISNSTRWTSRSDPSPRRGCSLDAAVDALGHGHGDGSASTPGPEQPDLALTRRDVLLLAGLAQEDRQPALTDPGGHVRRLAGLHFLNEGQLAGVIDAEQH